MNSSRENDAQEVARAASLLRVSEFEVFRLAYRNWFGHPAEPEEVDALFERYLRQAAVPMWVRDYTRRVQQLNKQGRLRAGRSAAPSPLPEMTYWRAFLGGMGFAFILMIAALLIYLAFQTQDPALISCRFPPCY